MPFSPLTASLCAQCGAAIDDFGPGGLCPLCLLRDGLHGSERDSPRPAEAHRAKVPAGGSFGSKPLLPFRFGDYEILDEVAQGGMGIIWKARQLSLNRLVAVKMLLAGPFARPSFAQRFRVEAEAAASLQHPNIVAIHDVGEHEGHLFFSMDYVEGRDLADLARQDPLPCERAARYVGILADAVQYAHDRGVLHRDLKPSNILLDKYDQLRITDFGLAKRLSEDLDLTTDGQVMGSPNYLSPEQARGRQYEIGPGTDI